MIDNISKNMIIFVLGCDWNGKLLIKRDLKKLQNMLQVIWIIHLGTDLSMEGSSVRDVA